MTDDTTAAVAALTAALEALDATADPRVHAVCRALDRLHVAVRVAGGRAPMWNSVAGLADTHAAALSATVPEDI